MVDDFPGERPTDGCSHSVNDQVELIKHAHFFQMRYAHAQVEATARSGRR